MPELFYEVLREYAGEATEVFLQGIGIRRFSGDVGFDLPAACRLMILPSQFIDVPVGIRMALPEGYWGRITGRSSTLRKRGLLVVEGVIDTGYRGPLFVGCYNLTTVPVRVEVGERLAQLIISRNYADDVNWVRTTVLPESDRGPSGFGSTGR